MNYLVSAACFALVTVLPLGAVSANAADIDAGRVKAEAVCQTCHGMDGIATTPVAANIAGQQQMYMKIQLERYRTGERVDPQMNIIAKMLSDDDIANVAAYYAAIKVTIEMPE